MHAIDTPSMVSVPFLLHKSHSLLVSSYAHLSSSLFGVQHSFTHARPDLVLHGPSRSAAAHCLAYPPRSLHPLGHLSSFTTSLSLDIAPWLVPIVFQRHLTRPQRISLFLYALTRLQSSFYLTSTVTIFTFLFSGPSSLHSFYRFRCQTAGQTYSYGQRLRIR